MSNHETAWIIEHYEEYVRNQLDGSDLEKTREALGHVVLDGVQTGEIEGPKPNLDWAIGLVNSAITPHRTKRRQSFIKNSEYLLDALQNPDEGIHIEPFLDRVFPLGSHDGRDKAFRYWTEEDLNASVIERYRNAAAVMEAAKEHDQVAQEWIASMRRYEAVIIEDVFSRSDAA